MKNKFVYLATIALMASGMTMAQSGAASQSGSSTATPTQVGGQTEAKGDLPGAKEGARQSGEASTANPGEVRPGVKGTAVTPDQGRSPAGTTPATGMDNGQKGTTDTNGTLPGAEPAPKKN
jgi:hypothetical protein